MEVLGEGVDVPDVDCLLLLRPTASPTVFTQQLGRGLRRATGKSHLTVIDLIGQHRREFRFENRLTAILDVKRGSVLDQVRADFPFLPSGCTVDLDRQSREIVLSNLKAAVRRSRWATLVSDLRSETDDVQLVDFLERNDHRLEDVYRSERSWTQLRRDAGRSTALTIDAELEARTLKALSRLTHIDDPERVGCYRELFQAEDSPGEDDLDERSRRLLTMLAWGLGSGGSGHLNLSGYFASLWPEAAVRQEFIELLQAVDSRSQTPAGPSILPSEIPLTLHARYSRQEVVAALGFAEGVKPKVTQGGILWVPRPVATSSSSTFTRPSGTTRRPRCTATTQSTASSSTGSRNHAKRRIIQPCSATSRTNRGTRVLLFVRERKNFELGTQPFAFLGPVTYVDHRGERPVAFTWRLASPMPEELFEVARSVAAA